MSDKMVTINRKARSDYDILETLEAGMSLKGTEVKSLREGRMNLKDSYAKMQEGEVYLVNAHISPYSHGNIQNHDPLRERKLLLHKQEIKRLTGKTEEKSRRPSQRSRLAYDRWRSESLRRIFLLDKITIAQVHGYCIGGGLYMSLCCDLTIAAEDAKIGHSEQRLGFSGAM